MRWNGTCTIYLVVRNNGRVYFHNTNNILDVDDSPIARTEVQTDIEPTDPAISTWITHGKFMCCQAIYMAFLEGLLLMLHMGDPRDN